MTPTPARAAASVLSDGELSAAPIEVVIENGWLAELTNQHTCGTGRDGHFGAHEPGCGLVPIATVAEALEALGLWYRLRDDDGTLVETVARALLGARYWSKEWMPERKGAEGLAAALIAAVRGEVR